MHKLLKLFFSAQGTNSWAVLACILTASLVEGIGFASLIPLLSIATGAATSEQSSQLITMTRDILSSLGLSMEIGVLLFFFITAMILKSLLSFYTMCYVGNAVATFATRLRSQLINNLFRVKWAYLIHHPIGRFTHAMSVQSDRASKAFQLVASFLAQLVQSVAYLTVAFYISWPLALAAIGIGAFVATSLHFLVRIARKAGIRQTQHFRELMVFLTDTLINLKPLRAMTQQAAFSHLLGRKLTALKKAIRRTVISTEGLRSSQEILVTLVLGSGFYFAVAHWQVPIIDLAVVGILLKKSTTAITKIQRLFQEAVICESPCIELENLLEETMRVPEHNPGRLRADYRDNIHLKNVSFSHGDKTVLHSVSMDIPTGCITVLTGPSGSGKTTLADIILGFYQPDAGQVLIDGIPLYDIELESWRRLIGYVPQDPILFNDTIFANVSLGDPNISKDDVRMALEMAGAWRFVIEKPQAMMSVTGQQGAKLSGGQRQRIAIARALVHKPKLLVLDEVTSALDPVTEKEICQNIRSLSATTTILAITHRPALLEVADRVYKIQNGVAGEQELLPSTMSAF